MSIQQFGHNAGTAAPHHQGQVYCEKTGKTVAVTFDDETGDKARLFAAAPELLAALEKLLPLWDREDVADTWSPEFEAACVAIAKATGQ